MGVLVFLLSVLPLAGGSHMNLMKARESGPIVSRLTPTVQSTAKTLYKIYIAMTLIEIVFLLLGGMSLFDSLTISFGSAGTGGFGVRNDSMASYSPYLQNVVTISMILFGINFNVYYLILLKKFRQSVLVEELRWYLGVIAVSILVITFNVRPLFGSLGEALPSRSRLPGGFHHHHHRVFYHRLQPVAPGLPDNPGYADVCWRLCRKIPAEESRFPGLSSF